MSENASVPRDEFFESMLADFLDESGQLLDRLNENMLQLDEWFRSLEEEGSHRCDMDLLNEMFRSAHSLKGLSAMLGLTEINHLTHKVENVFDAARKDELAINGDVVELMFQAVDRLVGLVDVLKDPNSEAVDCSDVLEGIHQVLDSAGVERKISSQADAEKALNQAIAEVSQAAEAGEPAAATPERVGESTESAVLQTEIPTDETPTCQTQPTAEALPPEVEIDHFAGLADESELSAKYVAIFIDETELSLDNLTDVLLTLENTSHREAIEQLLITSHRIKGSAASIGLNRVAKLAHLMEDLMQDYSNSGKSLTPAVIDALLGCIDGLRVFVNGLKAGRPQTDHFNRLALGLIHSQGGEETPRTATKATPSANAAVVPKNSPVDTSNSNPRTTAGSAPSQAAASPIDEALQRRILQNIKEAEWDFTLAGVVDFQPNLPLAGLKGQLLYEKLTSAGDIRYFSPPAEKMEEMEELAAIEFGLVTDKSVDVIRRLLRVAGVLKIDIQPLTIKMETESATSTSKKSTTGPAAPPAAKALTASAPVGVSAKASATADENSGEAAAKADKARATDNNAKPTETLRVDIERLDQLMNLAGQLVINKARFEQIGDKLKKAISGRQTRNAIGNISAILDKMCQTGENGIQNDLETIRSMARNIQNGMEEIRRDVEAMASVRTSVNDLFETIHLLDRVADGIQQSVMDTRMLPIGPLFQRFKRVIRDISRSNGKDIHLEINGEKTELDKRMIDELGDPLIHMVRNSADHGIESPEVRQAAGKPAQGTVSLDAFHRGNSIYIRVADDGKGLDSERIKNKALEKGLIAPAEAERMTKQQIFQLIWEPGLSTAEKVTEVSGRGMGMDIVKSKIEQLNGTVELDSEPGVGTTITIKLPLTLAILPSLMVSIDGDVFAMPLESVIEIVSVSPQDICTVHQRPTARVRGRVVSMVELGKVFDWHVGGVRSDAASAADNAASTLVIVGENGRELGLVVDNVIGEQDIVIKSMAENYRNVQGVAGASILGDGRISLILDLAAVIDMATCNKVEV